MNDIDISDTPQQTITPYFTIQGADRLMNFLVTAFDATIVKESRYDDGSVQHARVLIGNSLIMLNECTDDYSANVSQMHIYVENADTTYQSALHLGASSVMLPNDRPHGDRMAGIKDPCGNVWWLASQQT
ncbi:VOC family protein [Loktanella sp. Alg231-35]|uniref:VOC family protein n=1 Tax=Loktanella sp. Alg231-35 TaxID=1922220 RepID=UPI000D5561A5|nr:VOC family protein [Loktanella sp. Alg231-35]